MTDLEIPETGAVFTFGKSRFAENKPSHFFIKNDPVVHVACGDEHTAVICKNGRIFAFGSNEWGQLGLGHNNIVHKPSCVKALKPEKAKFIACGRAHTIILTESNNIYACGSNTDGQLGLDNVDMVNTPTKIQYNQLQENGIIKKLSAGSQHSAALTETGLLFVWGSNSEGQLGLESNRTNNKFPTLLEFKDKIRDISCGYYHTAVLTEKGELYTFGENENGKLGLVQTENPTYKPSKVNINIPVTSITCGGSQNFALTENGGAVAFGSNIHGELGFGKEVTWVSEPKMLPLELFDNEKLYMISCGDNHTAFVTENFKIYTCGDTRHGKLCQDDQLEDGQFGPKLITRFNNYKVTSVSCGGCHTIICAQKLQDDNVKTETNILPPLQRVPNSILNTDDHNKVKETAILTPTKLSETNNTNESIKNVNDENTEMKDNFTHSENTTSTPDIDNLIENKNDLITQSHEILEQSEKPQYNQIKKNGEVEDNINKTETNLSSNTQSSTIILENSEKEKEIIATNNTNSEINNDSVDNLLQEIEDNLNNKSDITASSDITDAKHSELNEKRRVSLSNKQEIDNEKHKTPINDDEDLKTDLSLPQPEKKFSKLFGTFKKKKSDCNTLEAKATDTEDNEYQNGTDIKNDEIQVNKTKIKTCTLL